MTLLSRGTKMVARLTESPVSTNRREVYTPRIFSSSAYNQSIMGDINALHEIVLDPWNSTQTSLYMVCYFDVYSITTYSCCYMLDVMIT